MLLCLFCFLTWSLVAQRADWSLSLNHFFDNTEFEGSSYQRPQTMAGVWLKPALSLELDSFSRIHAGINLLKEYGTPTWNDDIDLVSYYDYHRDRLNFQVGSFPREDVTRSFSRMFFQDSLLYYRPTMTGLWFHTGNSLSEAGLFMDWTGKKAGVEHEAFFIGAMGAYSHGMIFSSAQALLRHHAASQFVRGVQESAFCQVSLGLNLTQLSLLDTLTLQAGYLTSFQRDRTRVADWSVNIGLSTELKAGWRQLSLISTWYFGSGMMPEQARLGNSIYWGDPFYNGSLYGRTDVMYDFFKQDLLKLRVVLSHHYSEKQHFFEQSLVGCISIDSKRLKNK
jgi:hypothetical protein